ncbi:hypothetical protein GCM10007888_14790 [Methylobacterium oxalidis]|uniref:Hydantoinase B/oxoprolinase domain-containing protein n=1 Tax=Methylobacterium oxalidis TaxID=944322 RepID=A0ABQ6DE66_9HYPH|nr:hypothetical protein GCM10007888_14790 [Methylobacterium oxalidis]
MRTASTITVIRGEEIIAVREFAGASAGAGFSANGEKIDPDARRGRHAAGRRPPLPFGRGRVRAGAPGEGCDLSGNLAPLTLSLSRTGEGTRAQFFRGRAVGPPPPLPFGRGRVRASAPGEGCA